MSTSQALRRFLPPSSTALLPVVRGFAYQASSLPEQWWTPPPPTVSTIQRPSLVTPYITSSLSTTWNQSRRFFSTSSEMSTKTASQTIDLDNLPPGLEAEDAQMLGLLIEYQQRHGDCHVPAGTSKFAISERQRLEVVPGLVQWVVKRRQRYQYYFKKPKKNTPESERVIALLLESMGFMWSDREAQWQRAFNRLEAYHQKHGTLEVDKHEDPQLWNWVDQQRKAYAKDKLSEDRTRLLKEIGFVFELQEAAWQNYFEKLQQYIDEHGDARPPTHNEQDPSFGAWIARQRVLYQTGQLSDKRIDALESVGFSWNVHDETWDEYYAELVEFHEQHGHTRVPRTMSRLWHWVDRQRRYLRRRVQGTDASDTDSERYEALRKVGFEWDEDEEGRAKRLMDLTFLVEVFDERWTQNFEKLQDFKERFGHFVIPSKEPNFQELSNWVRHQRFLHKRGQLPADRVAALESIGFAWTAQIARWDIMFERLVRFQAEHGHTKIPTRNVELYRWVYEQRKLLRQSANKKLSGQAEQRLVALAQLLD
eukprot:Nitzschia sp. Nitz4//scaffold128_size63911//55204//56814//NITZ4_006233-RA/size63911-processed-gene-0.122-mRNA-1//1//CDS//3329534874//7799//frame0